MLYLCKEHLNQIIMFSTRPLFAKSDYIWRSVSVPLVRNLCLSLCFLILVLPGIVQAQVLTPCGVLLFSTGFQVWAVLLVLTFLVVLILGLTYRAFRVARLRQIFEKELLREKQIMVQEYEEQQRFYANLIHEVFKGEAQSILLEAPEESAFREQLIDFVKTCELGQYFVDKDNNDLYDLMKGMEFIFSSRLHSEMEERYFYCEIDPLLKGMRLNYHQKYELIFFLRECLNNIRKHAQSRHIGMKIKREYNVSGHYAVTLEVNDDGVGLQKVLGIEDPELEINENNLPQIFELYLKSRRCTGIREIFIKAARMKGKLVMRSVLGKGTKVNLRFFPDSG